MDEEPNETLSQSFPNFQPALTNPSKSKKIPCLCQAAKTPTVQKGSQATDAYQK
jgi:hypothetical protein